MSDVEVSDLLVHDVWDALPEELRGEFLARRRASNGWGVYPRQESDGRRWEPLRPVVIGEQAYRGLESLAARLLRLAVDACRRRASTLGELARVLRFPHDLPLMDPDRPLVAAELTRYARPDLLIEQGRPRLLEFNNSTRLGGATVTPRLAEAYARLCPRSGLHPPPSSVTARSAALARTLRAEIGNGDIGNGNIGNGNIGNGSPARLLMPAYWGIDNTGTARRFETAKPPILADARRLGLEVVQAELVDLRLDAAARLLAADVPIDIVLLEWGGKRIVDDGGGLAALRTADRARTVELFPRTESALISSKAILSWLHEDCDAGLLTPADHDLVRTHVPWTACLGLDTDPTAQRNLLRRPPRTRSSGRQTRRRQSPATTCSSAARPPTRTGYPRSSGPPASPGGPATPRRLRPRRDALPRSGLRSAGHRAGAVRARPLRHRRRSGERRGAPPGSWRPDQDVVISVSHGACQSTALLAPEPPAQ